MPGQLFRDAIPPSTAEKLQGKYTAALGLHKWARALLNQGSVITRNIPRNNTQKGAVPRNLAGQEHSSGFGSCWAWDPCSRFIFNKSHVETELDEEVCERVGMILTYCVLWGQRQFCGTLCMLFYCQKITQNTGTRPKNWRQASYDCIYEKCNLFHPIQKHPSSEQDLSACLTSGNFLQLMKVSRTSTVHDRS